MFMAHLGDMVYFPGYGVYPIVTTCGKWCDAGRPIAHIGALVACPGMPAVVLTGAPRCLDVGKPVSRVGDLAYSPKCKFGMIITGNPRCIVAY